MDEATPVLYGVNAFASSGPVSAAAACSFAASHHLFTRQSHSGRPRTTSTPRDRWRCSRLTSSGNRKRSQARSQTAATRNYQRLCRPFHQ
jgi:hypothetical protein